LVREPQPGAVMRRPASRRQALGYHGEDEDRHAAKERSMQQQYAFDPHNWATITPYFDALIDAPRSSDGFLAWLSAWNRLEIAVHDAWTQLFMRPCAWPWLSTNYFLTWHEGRPLQG